MAGAALSLLLVLSLAMRKTMSPLLLILAGLVVNLYLGSFSAMMMLFYPEESRGLAQWGAGSLVQDSWHNSVILSLQAVPMFVIIGLLIRPFSILALNESNAKSLGVPVNQLRLIGVLVAAFLIASVVSAVGMLGFVGLASAPMVRQFGVRSFRGQLFGAFVLGALLLSITDLALQLLAHFKGISLPTGAVTALIGTPLLLWLMFRVLPQSGRLQEQHLQKNRQFRPLAFGVMLGALTLAIFVALTVGKLEWWGFSISFDSALFDLRYQLLS